MTATLLIQPDEREPWTPGARRWFGVEGVAGPDLHQYCCTAVPPEFAALTQPCPTCEGRQRCEAERMTGSGGAYHFDQCSRWATTTLPCIEFKTHRERPVCTQHGNSPNTEFWGRYNGEPLWRCPDCHGGRPTATIAVPCDHPISRERCRKCGAWTHGLNIVGAAVLVDNWLPLEQDDGNDEGDHERIIVYDDGRRFAHHRRDEASPIGWSLTPIALSGYTQPGGWAGEFEPIEEATAA